MNERLPPAIVQARRLATRDALASLAVLLLSMPLLLLFLFSAALPALASLAVLEALSPLALPVTWLSWNEKRVSLESVKQQKHSKEPR